MANETRVFEKDLKGIAEWCNGQLQTSGNHIIAIKIKTKVDGKRMPRFITAHRGDHITKIEEGKFIVQDRLNFGSFGQMIKEAGR